MVGQECRVLLVDDDEDDFLITRDLLEEIEGSNYVLDWISTYEEAVEKIDGGGHDVYLLDYRLGKRTGLDLIMESRAKGCREPIILLTGQGDRQIDMEAMRAGASDYLVKSQLTPPLLERSIRYSIKHAQSEKKLAQLAEFDTLTGLPNRHLFHDRLQQAVFFSKRQGAAVGVMFLDLDRFKRINDSLGHSFGDELLKAVAKRLSGCVREGDTVARLGGDEFVIILPNLKEPFNVTVVAKRVIDAIDQPFHISGQEIYTATSIGISIYPLDDANIGNLLKKADSAMYQAKAGGGKSFKFYTSEMNLPTVEHLKIETSLHRALDRDEFRIHYQPVFHLPSGEISGAEALLRWHPHGKPMQYPDRFIPLLEETGLIIQVGEWVLSHVLAQAAEWGEAVMKGRRISVNLSSRQLRAENFFSRIATILRNAQVPPSTIVLELTETMVMEDIQRNGDILKELKNLDLGLAMDDFGTGYSSLSCLKYFPFDAIKVDKSFVANIGYEPQDEAIVRAIIAMAHSMGMAVVAEGVETAKQLEFLRENRCDFAQGNYFSSPLPAEEFLAYLSRHP